MSYFVFGFYALLLTASCLAAYFNKRTWFLTIFAFTLVSFVLGIVGAPRCFGTWRPLPGCWRWRQWSPTPFASS